MVCDQSYLDSFIDKNCSEKRVSYEASQNKTLISNSILNINCNASAIKCIDVKCITGPFGTKKDTQALFGMQSALRMDVIRNAYGLEYTSIDVAFELKAIIHDKIDSTTNIENVDQLIITFRKKYGETVKSYVYVISIGAGILLLVGVTILLVSV